MDALEREYRARMSGRTFEEQVEELARIRDDEGYMAESHGETQGEYTLVEHHCPIYAIAKRYPQACQYEQALFTRTLNAEVQRIEHKITGDGRCRYLIKRPARQQEAKH
jgi:predicted ArsR family transcriptional regulator